MRASRANRLGLVLTASMGIAAFARAQAPQVKELAGHKEAVAAISYSPDGNTIATGSFDKTIKLWDPKTLKEVRTLEGHTGMVLALAFTKDGKQLLTGAEDKLVKLWNLSAAQAAPKALPPLPALVRGLAISADGKTLAAAEEDGVIRLLESESGKVVKELPGHAGPVYAVRFSADGTKLYSVGADRTARLWDIAAGKAVASLEVGSQPATALAVDPKQQAIYTGGPTGQVARWNLPWPEVKALAGHAGEVGRLLLHPAGKELISIGSDKTVRGHDVATGNPTRTISAPGAISDFAVSPADPNLLATVGDDKAIRLWTLTDNKQVAAKENLAQPATAVAFLPDGKGMVIAEADGTLRLYAYPFQDELAAQAIPAHDAALTALSRSADGTLILTASEDKQVRLWDAAGKPIRAFAMFAPIRFAAISPDKQFIAAVDAQGQLRIWAANGQELRVTEKVAGPIAFSPDGKVLAAAGADNKVYLHATGAAAEPKPLATHTGPIKAITFNPAGTAVLSGGADKVLKLSDVATGKEAASLAGHAAALTALAVSPDGKLAYSGGEDKSLIIWDLAMGKAVGAIAGATGPVVSLAASGDGKLLAAATADGNVRLYQGTALAATLAVPGAMAVAFRADNAGVVVGSTDKNLRLFTVNAPRAIAKHGSKVNQLAVTPDGKTILSAGDDGHVRGWDLASGAAVKDLAHVGAVTAIALSADGAKLASGSADKTSKVWTLADGKNVASFAATNAVVDVAFSKDGQKVAFTSADNLTRVMALAGPELATFTINQPRGVRFVDDMTVAIGSSDKQIRLAKLTRAWSQSHGGAVTALALTSDGAKLLSAAGDNTVVVRNAADGAPVKPIAVPAPTSIALAADNVKLLVGSGDKTLRLFDANTGAAAFAYPAGAAAIHAVALSADGKMAGSVDANGGVSLWSTPVDKIPGQLVTAAPTSAPGTACVFLSDNVTLAGVGGDKSIRLVSPPPPPVYDLVGHTAQVYGVAASPDNALAASGGADNKVLIWDLPNHKASKTLEGHKAQVYGVAFSPDGKTLASASADKTVILWDLATGKATKSLGPALDALYQVNFTPDGKFILAGGVDKQPRLWDIATAKEVRPYPGQPDEIYGLKLSPSGKRFATSGYTGAVLVWDLESAKPVFQHKGSFGAFDVAYHPAGAQLAVANNDKKAYLIDLPEAAR